MTRKYLRNRSKLRTHISKYPISQRRRVRTNLSTPSSPLHKYVVNGKTRQKSMSWKERMRPSTKARARIGKMTKSKTLRNGLIASVTVGTLLTALPKETLADAADTVQEFGETIYNMGEDIGDTTGSLIRVVGSSADALANGLGFLSDNFGTLVTVTLGGWIMSKYM